MDQKAHEGFIAAYRKLPPKELSDRVRRAEEILKCCILCPRNCMADRSAGIMGFCRTGNKPFVSSHNPHFGEEAPLTGTRGSGTIFFTHCNLGCIFCQNWSISHLGEGGEISFRALADIMLTLQDQGCHNINLVTPTHQAPMILRSLEIASAKGLKVPIVYNCGGYESVETLQLLDGVIDIYMPDLKFFDPAVAQRLAMAGDYPDIARAAVKEMHRQVGDLVMDENGIALRGLLVRHLVLPGGLAGTKEIVTFLADEISPDTYTNIMAQYYPCFKAAGHPPLDRRITEAEYRDAVDAAREAGLRRLD